MKSSVFTRSFLAAAMLSAFAGQALAQTSAIPALNSRPNAPYTLYLNFGGFTYPGAWGGRSPGTTPAFDTNGTAGTFTTTEIAQMREIFARTAEKYSVFGINVTTVDPAIAAGQAATDTARRNYYDVTPRIMHTVVGGSGSWYGQSGVVGVSNLNTVQFGNGTAGAHTNWTFSSNYGSYLQGIAETIAHEDGHGLNLGHSNDQNNRGNAYSSNGGVSGPGTFAPIMGNSDDAQRGLWRIGATGTGSAFQNDVLNLISLGGIGAYVDAGIGHSIANATPLAITGNSVNFNLAKGIITPMSTTSPNPLGTSNYTQDYFAFSTLGGAVTLTSNDGSQYITPGVSDPGATMDSELEILDSTGAVIGTGVASADTLKDTFTGNLAAGTYYARISSIGGYQSTYEAGARYYTMGSYFLTGTGFTSAVPEPATMAVMGLGVAMLARRRRNKRA